jgi:hypothetical protein
MSGSVVISHPKTDYGYNVKFTDEGNNVLKVSTPFFAEIFERDIVLPSKLVLQFKNLNWTEAMIGSFEEMLLDETIKCPRCEDLQENGNFSEYGVEENDEEYYEECEEENKLLDNDSDDSIEEGDLGQESDKELEVDDEIEYEDENENDIEDEMDVELEEGEL